jgi:hypothetical protein
MSRARFWQHRRRMRRWRRLVRDYEQRCDVSEAMIGVAMGGLLSQ